MSTARGSMRQLIEQTTIIEKMKALLDNVFHNLPIAKRWMPYHQRWQDFKTKLSTWKKVQIKPFEVDVDDLPPASDLAEAEDEPKFPENAGNDGYEGVYNASKTVLDRIQIPK